MADQNFRAARLVPAAAAVAAPVAIVFGLLAALGLVDPMTAVGAAASIILCLTLIVGTHFRHLANIAGYLGRMTRTIEDSAAVPPPGASAGATADLYRAVADAGRAWSARRRDLESVVAANDAVIAGLPEPLIMLDRSRRILRANPAAAALFGQVLDGRDLLSVLRNPAVIDAVAAALGSGSGQVVEFSLPVPIERNFLVRVEPLTRPIADGTVALLTLHDVTDARQMDRMRADFVANASHELRTPLSTLVGFIETLRGPARDDGPARERFLAIMQEQAQRMARLVADLLSLSRIELNEHRIPAGQVKLAEIIRTVIDGLAFRASGKEIRIEIDSSPPGDETPTRLDELPAVAGDGDELTQVFQNLIDNAIKYGRQGSTIRIASWLTSGTAAPSRLRRPGVAIAVADEGDGIAREHIPRLTERFYRVDTARSRELGGTGLGLAIVKHILNRHRGILQIDSVLGRGSVFTVHLPIAG